MFKDTLLYEEGMSQKGPSLVSWAVKMTWEKCTF